MAPDISVVQVPARHFAGVRRRVKPQDIGKLCGEALPRVCQWVKEKGQNTANSICVYFAHDEAAGEFDVQAGWFITGALEGEGDIVVGEMDAGEAAHVVHVGPYDKLGETWGAAWGWVKAQGREVSKPAWEVYVSDPSQVKPEELTTEIYIPLD